MKVVSTANNRASRRGQASESRISSQLTCAKERTTLRNEDGLSRQVPLLTVFGIVELGIVLGRFSLSSFVSTISWPKTHRLACMRLKLPLHNNAGTTRAGTPGTESPRLISAASIGSYNQLVHAVRAYASLHFALQPWFVHFHCRTSSQRSPLQSRCRAPSPALPPLGLSASAARRQIHFSVAESNFSVTRRCFIM